MGFLRTLVGAGVIPWLLGNVLLAHLLLEVAASQRDCFAREVGGIRSHVGDQANQPYARQIDAFVELLGDSHGAIGRHPQSAAGSLLQGAGNERGIWPGAGAGDVDRFNGVASRSRRLSADAGHVMGSAFGFGNVLPLDVEVCEPCGFGGCGDSIDQVGGGGVCGEDLQRRTGHFDEVGGQAAVIGQPRHAVANNRRSPTLVPLCHEGGPGLMQGPCLSDIECQTAGDFPGLFRREGTDLLLPFHHETGGYTLHAAGTQTGGDFFPEHRRHLVADDPVYDAAGLLGLHARHVDRSRMLESSLHFGLGN